MKKWLSFTASKDWFYRISFANAGLRSVTTDLGGGTTVHCWVPKNRDGKKPNLLLLHGFGANAMWQYKEVVRQFTAEYNVYVPDLQFFGRSWTAEEERTEGFQAESVMGAMQAQGVAGKMSVVGISYGGFVGYAMAARFPEAVERVVLCCAGVAVEEKDMKDGLFVVADVEEAATILVPQTPEKLKELTRLSFVRPLISNVPSYFLSDYIKVMCTKNAKEQRELIQTALKGRKFSNLPKITQPTLILWGEEDQIFPLELGYRLKRHLGSNAEMEVIKNAGHAVNLEKPKEFIRHLKSFLLIDRLLSHPSAPQYDVNSNKLH
ncbi:uncharacterized protein LOC131164237 [Malania oleifera]|uniref:uncharacterized protein LOC131164237 n=1 Tax=Malania oleifera TaxID=397392 RepID=UPI0025AE7871|nr:uncharacterized protein LOC131164237 [Malania oleifera]